MRSSKVLLGFCLAGTVAALQTSAQTTSPELQAKALELLHQAMSQPPPVVTGEAAVTVRPASQDPHDLAVQKLRQESVASTNSTASKPAKSVKAKSTKAPEKSAAGTAPAQSAAPATASASLADPEPAPVLTTKQRRLMDLLDEYRADKITPAEYQARRARILVEP